jgi:excisionase family DNA binding protein
MSTILSKIKESLKGNGSSEKKEYMTTTEFAKLCGVSRFTIINWTKQGKIKAIKTAGGHYRIPEKEALTLLERSKEKNNRKSTYSKGKEILKGKKAEEDVECSNCLTEEQQDEQRNETRKNFLYNFGYGIGRGVQILKERR